jgi:hypothetical protein
MVLRNPAGALTADEKRIVKALLASGERNQDIQALINTGRCATVNSARITEVKQDTTIEEASPEEVEFFKNKQRQYDPLTGLNLFDDERLIRSREAMTMAVHVFNSPSLRFKTEIFAVLANIAWTYLLHEHYARNGVDIVENGKSLLLSQMIKRSDVPLTQGMKDNLNAVKTIRDEVEHILLRKGDTKFAAIFQACCLNYDQKIRELFGDELSLQNELSFSLQFAKPSLEQFETLTKYDISPEVEALDANLEGALNEERLGDVEYRFRVVYTLENSTKSKAHFKFVSHADEEAEEIRNVLIKREISDNMYPLKPTMARRKIADRSGRQFTSHNHTQAWRKFNVRPRTGSPQPAATNKDYCVYHEAHGDYTYSEAWVEFVAEYIKDDQNFEELKAYKL